MDKLERCILLISSCIEDMKRLKNLINSNDIDEETKQQLIKDYKLKDETLKRIEKNQFLIAGGSLEEFNKLIAELDNEEEQEGLKNPAADSQSLTAVAEQEQPKQEPKQEPKTILLNDVYKLNLEYIKQMTFEEIEHDKNIYNDSVDLKRQIIETITNIDLNNKNPESEMLNQRAINYYFEKIELLKQYSKLKELKNVVNLCRKYDQLKITLETIKLLESIRKNLIYYGK